LQRNEPLEHRGQDMSYVSFQGMNLDGADFSDAILTGANFSGCSLRRAVFAGAKLDSANFSDADLFEATLSRASLQGANFVACDLARADFHRANLTGSNLDFGVAAASCDLSFITAEKERLVFPLIDSIKEASKLSFTLYVSFLLFSVYAVLSASNVADVDLLRNSGTLTLPLINTAVPLAGFFVAAPLLIVVIQYRLACQLSMVWDLWARLPRKFPNALDKNILLSPWLILVPSSGSNARLVDMIVTGTTVFLVGPLACMWLWFRYLPTHDLPIAFILIAAFATSCAISAAAVLRYSTFVWPRYERSPLRWPTSIVATIAAFAGGLGLLGYLTDHVYYGEMPRQQVYMSTDQDGFVLKSFGSSSNNGPSSTEVITNLLSVGSFRPFAVITQTDISRKPPGWSGGSREQINLVLGANFSARNLAYANFSESFLAKTDFRGARLQYTNFGNADLRQANFSVLELVDISSSTDQKTGLQYTHLYNSLFFGANMSEANLATTIIRKSNLSTADLSNAILGNAKISDTYLIGADLRGAVLKDATFENVRLHGARLEGADLSSVRVSPAELATACLNADTVLPYGMSERPAPCTRRLKRWEIVSLMGCPDKSEKVKHVINGVEVELNLSGEPSCDEAYASFMKQK
jgi:uncharacterized protein YjbI with pentapeptide repeats